MVAAMPPLSPTALVAAPSRRVGIDPRRLPVSRPDRPSAGVDDAQVDELLRAARRGAARTAWPLDGHLARARNAHATNRVVELRAALAGDFDWLEVDVRRIAGTLVASHDPRPAPDALPMTTWLRIAATSRRGIKLDLKERDAIAPTLDLVRAAGIPDERLVINVPIDGTHALDAVQLRRIRRRFPRATINLSLGPGAYRPSRLAHAASLARAVGGPVAFPIDVARATPAVVRTLTAAGLVSIWNDPRRTPIRDIGQTVHQLRTWGVDGTIDLR